MRHCEICFIARGMKCQHYPAGVPPREAKEEAHTEDPQSAPPQDKTQP